MEAKVVTIAQACKMLGVCRNKLADLLQSGKIHAIKSGRRWLIPTWAIDRFLEGK